MAQNDEQKKSIFTAIASLFGRSRPGEFTTRLGIEQALQATNSPNATTPVIEPTVIAKKGMGVGVYVDRTDGPVFHRYLDRENLRHARYSIYDRMDTDLVASALDVYANESTQKGNNPTVINVSSSSKYIQDELMDMLENTGLNNYKSWSILRDMCKYGDRFESVKIDSKRGVVGLLQLDPRGVYRLDVDGELQGYVQDMEVVRQNSMDASSQYSTQSPFIDLTTLSLPYMTRKMKTSTETDKDNLIPFLKYEMLHFRLRGRGIFEPYGTCLKYNTRVETEFGYKEIQHITTTDKVWSLDINGNRVLSAVLDVVNSGNKQTYKISTMHNSISASAEHRILTINPATKEFEYKYPTNLCVGDLLAISTKKLEYTEVLIDKTKPETNKNGYWANIDLIPDYVTEDFARLFGFLLGDGWIHNENTVSFAAGINQTANEKYINLLEKFTGKVVCLRQQIQNKTSMTYAQVACGSKMLVTILRRLGFSGKATTKRLPQWVFTASPEIKKALLLGLIDADGSLFIDTWNCLRYSIELNNEELIRDVKTLVSSLGLKSGKISSRKRSASAKIDDRIITPTTTSWQFYFFDSEITQLKHSDKRKTTEYIVEHIRSIEVEESESETWDIHVSADCHNFFANGIVVHNSVLEAAVDVWKKLDLLLDSIIIYRLNRGPARLVFYVDVGNNQGADIENLVKRQINAVNKREYYDPSGRLNERYQLLDMNANIFIPVSKTAQNSKVDMLQPAPNLGDIEDLTYLNNRLFSALKVPKAFLGFEGDVSSKGTLSQQNVTFGKAIQNIQEDYLDVVKNLCVVHLAIKGITDQAELKSFSLVMTRPSYVEERSRIELDSEAMNLAASYLGQGINRNWVLKHILKKDDADIKEMTALDPQAAAAAAAGGGAPGGMGGGGMPGLDLGMGGAELPPEMAPPVPGELAPGQPNVLNPANLPPPAPEAGALTASRSYNKVSDIPLYEGTYLNTTIRVKAAASLIQEYKELIADQLASETETLTEAVINDDEVLDCLVTDTITENTMRLTE